MGKRACVAAIGLLAITTHVNAQQRVSPPARQIAVHFKTNQEGVAFHYAPAKETSTSALRWTRLCQGECEVMLEPGRYRIGLSHGASTPVAAENAAKLRAPVTLEGGYTSYASHRQAGWLVLGIAGISSLATVLAGAGLSGTSEGAGAGLMAGGALGVVLSLTMGIALLNTDDDVSVSAVVAR